MYQWKRLASNERIILCDKRDIDEVNNSSSLKICRALSNECDDNENNSLRNKQLRTIYYLYYSYLLHILYYMNLHIPRIT